MYVFDIQLLFWNEFQNMFHSFQEEYSERDIFMTNICFYSLVKEKHKLGVFGHI